MKRRSAGFYAFALAIHARRPALGLAARDRIPMALKLGEILIGRRLISAAELESALAEQRARGGRLGEVLVRRGAVRPGDLKSALSEQSRSFVLAAALLVNGGVSAGTPAFAAAQKSASAAQASSLVVGTALSLAGAVEAVDLEGGRRRLERGDPLFEGEIVETGPGGEARVLFADGSTLNVGSNAAVILDRFVYDAAADGGSRAAATAKAALRSLAGAATYAPPKVAGGATAGVRA